MILVITIYILLNLTYIQSEAELPNLKVFDLGLLSLQEGDFGL
jgi:hypothetical protein